MQNEFWQPYYNFAHIFHLSSYQLKGTIWNNRRRELTFPNATLSNIVSWNAKISVTILTRFYYSDSFWWLTRIFNVTLPKLSTEWLGLLCTFAKEVRGKVHLRLCKAFENGRRQITTKRYRKFRREFMVSYICTESG